MSEYKHSALKKSNSWDSNESLSHSSDSSKSDNSLAFLIGKCFRNSTNIQKDIDTESKKTNEWSCKLPFDVDVYGKRPVYLQSR